MTDAQSYSVEPPCEPSSRSGLISIPEWASEYGLIPRLITLEQRSQDPIELLRSIREMFDGLPETAATVRLGVVADSIAVDIQRISDIQPLMELSGSWRYTGTENSLGEQWVNPNYVHLTALKPNVTDPDERMAILERLANYGVLAIGKIAPQFGITEESLRRWLTRHEVPWSEWRLEGIQRLARTCHTISKWGDWSENKLADALPVKRGTLKKWIHTHARDTSFRVPADPSGEPWFSKSNNAARGDSA